MPIDSIKVVVLTPQMARLAPQLSQKTVFWWLSSKTAKLAELLKKQAVSKYLLKNGKNSVCA